MTVTYLSYGTHEMVLRGYCTLDSLINIIAGFWPWVFDQNSTLQLLTLTTGEAW